jgi:hypothetical protein
LLTTYSIALSSVLRRDAQSGLLDHIISHGPQVGFDIIRILVAWDDLEVTRNGAYFGGQVPFAMNAGLVAILTLIIEAPATRLIELISVSWVHSFLLPHGEVTA